MNYIRLYYLDTALINNYLYFRILLLYIQKGVMLHLFYSNSNRLDRLLKHYLTGRMMNLQFDTENTRQVYGDLGSVLTRLRV